jgi:hypothetical protein
MGGLDVVARLPSVAATSRTWVRAGTVCAVPLLLGGAALSATYFQAPLRTIVGLYFLAALVPALQLIAGAFLGWRAAAVSGLAIAALTAWQVIGPPPVLSVQPTQWTANFTAADQQYRATLLPPPHTRAAVALQHGGKATLQLCLARGTGEDLDIRLQGQSLAAVALPNTSNCWLRLAVPSELLPAASPAPLVVTITPKPASLAAADQRSTLIGGYTRLAGQGGRSGGAEFFDGREWQRDDLAPLVEGQQQGRLFVELRALDALGNVVEVWY